ncbi:GAF domain-containing protein [Shewanella sp. NIFS-20-20]|uniref:GAF domain-containing protein n=1 Tax=Shewanella sp. NIFS-20-20 TaxID=2853806 RepID=UPI001C45F352|nr:GAF domain-containing protein [Shewanella sp. NIFS-20-20]MBV7314608.1 GAF domain-containing protein [Shewanella sp. NIFS-20-20]
MESICYTSLNRQFAALIEGEGDVIACLANMSAFLNEHVPNINWVGFYLRQGDQLVLGPFQGKVACTRIPWGQGVCGTAAALDTVQRVANVHDFSGHISCDSASNAEIVLPVHYQQAVFAVLDIDSPVFDRFSEDDQLGLSLLVKTLEQHLNISPI